MSEGAHTTFEVPSGLPDIVTLGALLWGDPTKRKPNKVTFGDRESKVVIPAPINTWYDHEAEKGGGYCELYKLKYGAMPARPGFPIPPDMARDFGEPVSWWDYHSETNTLVARVVRFQPPGKAKTYRQCRPDGDRWRWKMDGLKIPLYRLPELLAAEDGATVFIPEGEKHCDQLRSWGLLATTNAGGAKKFRADHAATLARFDCVILPDNDEAGAAHAEVVIAALRKAGCKSIRVLDLPNLPHKGDVIDWVGAGGTAEAFVDLAAKIETEEVPPVTSKRRRVRGQVDEAKPPSAGPVIQVVAGKLHITTTAAEDALIASGLPIYQRGDCLVQPITREVAASRGRMTLAAALGDLNVYSLVDIMCGTAEFERYDARADDWVRINPPTQIAQILLSRQGKWHFPVVAGIITTPTLRPDGTLLTEPGYDAATRLYHVADPSLKLDSSVHSPCRATAERALKDLELLLAEFPFVKMKKEGEPDKEVAKAVALSGLITPVVRGAMSVAPLHAINAHAPGSGKSFLIDLISLISAGRPCPVISAAPDEGETEKRIAGLLLDAYPIVSIDNCNGELGGDLLCQAVERPLIRIRRLGASDIVEIESSVTMYATGNNIRVRGDMVRRSLVAELDPQLERPELKKFEHDPVASILADRGRYVSACLIIARAYILANRPNRLPSLASFEEWSDLVRSALVWLGCADPVVSMEAARADDPELAQLREMLAIWGESLGFAEGFTAAEVVRAAEERERDRNGEPAGFCRPDFRDALVRSFGDRGTISTRRMSRWMGSHEGRIVDGHRFERRGQGHGGLMRWGVRAVNAG
jgi:putative DNA primase/helicase